MDKNLKPVGVQYSKNKCQFNLWAPKAKKVQVELLFSGGSKRYDLTGDKYGYFTTEVEEIPEGTKYRYSLNDGPLTPDIASFYQPEGIHGPSEVVSLNFDWNDQDWNNIAKNRLVLYELHIGTFTNEGTIDALIEKLPYLKDLGITAIELMPVNQFSGDRNWGYDGVFPFAVHNTYGSPRGLMNFVNECHKTGLAVILDVVYNHIGPDGNYLKNFAPYFSSKYKIPWGDAINFDDQHSDGVRNYFIQNALMWFRDFHIDGLRLDAVHAIYDDSPTHFLAELSEHVRDLEQELDKTFYLIPESHMNDVKLTNPNETGGYNLDIGWSDDYHHSLHALITGESDGYYKDYGTKDHFVRALKNAHVYDGQWSEFKKRTYGTSTKNNSADEFLIYNQNHDQVGNRPGAERLSALIGFEMQKVIAGTLFTSPFIPMLFMGEEYGEQNPYYYFINHQDEKLNEKVRKGREREFKAFYETKKGIRPPHPDSLDAFNLSKLSWDIHENEKNRKLLEYFSELIQLRTNDRVFSNINKENLKIDIKNELIIMLRWINYSQRLVIVNFEKDRMSYKNSFKHSFTKILDSTEKCWYGTNEVAIEHLIPGEETDIAPESIVIYKSN